GFRGPGLRLRALTILSRRRLTNRPHSARGGRRCDMAHRASAPDPAAGHTSAENIHGTIDEERKLPETDNIALIRRFLEACVRADPDEFAGYFTEDAVWWNSPWPPCKG